MSQSEGIVGTGSGTEWRRYAIGYSWRTLESGYNTRYDRWLGWRLKYM
jgi:hypothetical protein